MTAPGSANPSRSALTGEMLRALGRRFGGDLVTPDDEGYDDARSVWNGMIDKRPAVVGRCGGVDDVAAAVQWARSHDVPLAVRGGGHNVSGSAVCDGGIVIDLSAMNAIDVDPDRGTVRAGGGVTIGQLDRETQAHRLAVPMGVVTETGIAGLTLSGGMGWTRRKFGLSCDHLLGAEVVTASGDVVRAAPDGDADLLWALRGGGGNFGVVTALEYQAHPLGPDVFFTVVFHPADAAGAALGFYREWSGAAADEISAFAVLWRAPAIDEIPEEHHAQPVLVYAAMHAGDPSDGERALASLRGFGKPIADLSGTLPYLEVQQFFDEDYPAHVMRYYWKSIYLRGLDQEVIEHLVTLNERSPSPHSTIDIWQLGGAFSRVDPSHAAFGDRSAPFMVGIESNWERPQDDAACIAWAREVYREMEPFSTGAEYLNFPGFHEGGDDTVRRTFGSNYERLAAVKQRHDPANLFRMNANIRPAGAH